MNSPDVFFTAPLSPKFHRRETGSGFLRASNGGEVGCCFVLDQTAPGDITLRCLLDTAQSEAWRKRPPAQEWYAEHKNLSLDLVTRDGYVLENIRFHPVSGGVVGSTHEFDLSSLDLRRTRQTRFERPVAFAEFSIVNFHVEGGNAGVRFSNLWHWDDVVLLRLGDRECWLRAVENAEDIIKELKATKGIGVTATVRLPLHSLDEWDDIEGRVDNLSTVLTLLSGNRVTWISARAIDSLGYALQERWRDSVTNPYTTHDMLNTLSDKEFSVRISMTSYVPIIEHMMSRIGEAEKKWNIRAAINTWHETVISDHFPEQRGLLVAACMEMLRARYLKHGGRETILAAEIFDAKKNAICKDLKKSLKACFPVQDEWSDDKKRNHNRDLSLMYSHVKSLNYFPFRKSLEQMAHELGMMAFAPDDPANNLKHRLAMQPLDASRADPNELKKSIECFVRIRDHLTHQGAFVLTAADQADEESESAGDERIGQLHFLQRFAAAFLCSALGWTQPLPAARALPKEPSQVE